LTLSLCAFQRPLCRAGAGVNPQHRQWPTASRGVTKPPVISRPRCQYWWSAQCNDADNDDDKEDSALHKPSPLLLYRRSQRRTVNIPRRIHVLGVGSVGGFVAHSLAGLPQRPPITLLFSERKSLIDWYEQGESVRLTINGMLDARSNFDVEQVQRPRQTEEPQEGHKDSITQKNQSLSTDEVIHNLIVSVKAFNTVGALKRVAHRLTPQSSILFIQNGMGVIEEVNDLVFPNPDTRPQYVLGITTHGIYRKKPFNLVHGGHGTTALAILPRDIEEVKPDFAPSALYLLRTMTRTPVLAAVGFAPTDLLQLQIEKLAVNAIISPLTALMGCLNGDLLHRPSVSRVIRLLLAEISLVIRSLPELQGVPNVKMRFDIKRLEAQVLGIAEKTARNKSSMLQDVSQGRLTEIEYINGYIVRRGEEVGIRCALNYMLMHMIKAKGYLEGERHGVLLPLENRVSR
ncbi:MAG: hypothetical protein Q9173_004590, partial [Seirophora scorigena]